MMKNAIAIVIMQEKSNLQKALDSIEEFANKNGYGMYESTFDDEGERGEIHLMPCTKLGIAISPHNANSNCICSPKMIRGEPVKIYAHNRIEI